MVRLGHESRSSVSDLVHTQYGEKNSWKKHSGLTKDNEPSSDLKNEILKPSVVTVQVTSTGLHHVCRKTCFLLFCLLNKVPEGKALEKRNQKLKAMVHNLSDMLWEKISTDM